MNILVISASLNEGSRSRLLAREAEKQLKTTAPDATIQWVDLRDYPLPFCDAGASYGDPNVNILADKIKAADVVLIAVPIYNFDINAALKNLTEMTGSAWKEKMVGFLCAAGGRSSYMSIMGFANSLMLDFRCTIIPRFVYATYPDFTEDVTQISSPDIIERIGILTDSAVLWAKRLTITA